MEIDDVCDASHGERHRTYLKDFYGMTGASHGLTQDMVDHSHQLATTEMLDEIHTMLRHLLLMKGVDVG